MTSLSTLEDGVLIQRTLAGDGECFAVLMNRHMSAVRGRVRSMLRNTSDEDDIIQETFLNAWRHLSSFRSDSSFRTWITRVAMNEVLQQYRRDRRYPATPAAAGLDAFPSQSESPHDELARVEARREIRAGARKLPAKYRRVLILRDFD